MPELPDIISYQEALEQRLLGATLHGISLTSPFLLRSAVPPLASAFGRQVAGIERLGKRLVIALAGELFLVIHLMVAGRFQWQGAGQKKASGAARSVQARFEFSAGTLLLTEAGTKRRAALHLIEGRAALAAADPGGIDPLACTRRQFEALLARAPMTIKRALTDPALLAGIGNAYSDEILHRARLSPFLRANKLSALQANDLHQAMQSVLTEWIDRLRSQLVSPAEPSAFPTKVTAFRPEMAAHGKFGQPCPVCGAPIQRIVHAENESNYCARCQTGGSILADRALSRLLKDSWPRNIDELG